MKKLLLKNEKERELQPRNKKPNSKQCRIKVVYFFRKQKVQKKQTVYNVK